MKLVEKNLNLIEFEGYLESIQLKMESETTYIGTEDESVPYTEDLKVKYIYGDENNEQEAVLYVEKYDEETNEITYDIYKD